MKKTIKILLILVFLIFGTFISSVAWGFLRDAKLYQEAEPLVHVVWPLAVEIKSFYEKNNRLPISLEEINDFSGHDFSPLKKFNPSFNTSDERIFQIKINRKFGFYISNNFQPQWITSYEKNPQIPNKTEKHDTPR